MKYSFPILTLLALALGLALLRGETRTKLLLAVLGKTATVDPRGDQRVIPDPDGATPDRTAFDDGAAANPNSGGPIFGNANLGNPNDGNPNPDGQALIAESARRIHLLPSLSVEMRYRIDLFGNPLSGKGYYLQQGVGDVKLLRFVVLLGAQNRTTNLSQICDGAYLWVQRDSPLEKSVTRTDLREVRRSIEANPKLVAAGLSNQWMALGGLPKLLKGLDDTYQFGPARPFDNPPVLEIVGRLKPTVLARLLPTQRDRILAGQPANLAALPPQWATMVRVRLGRDDALPLFPYNIEFLRSRPSSSKEGDSLDVWEEAQNATPMVAMDLYDVQIGREIDRGQFSFDATKQPFFDNTQQFLQKLEADP